MKPSRPALTSVAAIAIATGSFTVVNAQDNDTATAPSTLIDGANDPIVGESAPSTMRTPLQRLPPRRHLIPPLPTRLRTQRVLMLQPRLRVRMRSAPKRTPVRPPLTSTRS